MNNLEEIKEWAENNPDIIFKSLDFEPRLSGRYFKSSCPIPYHPGDADNGGAFSWNIEQNYWGCWTHQCHDKTSNNIFGFVMAMKECNFYTAVRYIKKIMDSKPVEVMSKRLKKNKYKKQIKLNPSKLELLMSDFYFSNRGIDKDILELHKVGYWQKEGTFMNKRAIVPLFDIDGNLVGFSGRTLLDKEEIERKKIGKWIHALDFVVSKTEDFNKSSILYNLDKCKNSVLKSKNIYLVEGPIDCWKLQMAGFINVVATLGLGLSLTQINLLIKLGVEHIVICYDNDTNKAGEQAAERIANQVGDMFNVTIRLPKNKDYGEMNPAEIKEMLSVL